MTTTNPTTGLTGCLTTITAEQADSGRYADDGGCWDVTGRWVSPAEYQTMHAFEVIASTSTWGLAHQITTARFAVQDAETGRRRFVIETTVSDYADRMTWLAQPAHHVDERTARAAHAELVAKHGGAFLVPAAQRGPNPFGQSTRRVHAA